MNGAAAPGRIYLVVWALIPVLVPFYLMGRDPKAQQHPGALTARWAPKTEGGVPQVADYVAAAFMALVFAGLGLCLVRSTVPVVRAFALYVGHVALVNACWAAWLGQTSLWMSTVFYLYEFLLFLTFLVLYARFGEQLLRVTAHAVAASVFLQVLLSPLAIQRGWARQPLFFHNENQLGHFAVVSATLFFVAGKRFPVRLGYRLAFYGGAVYLAVLSVSKAALLGIGLLVVLAILERPSRFLGAGLVLGALLLGAAALPRDMVPDAVASLEQRLSAEESDDTLEARGYDRILYHPEYLFFGAGEGVYARFRSAQVSELHSSFGTILFSYGVVGVGLFAYGLYLICRPDPKLALSLLPPFAVGLAHNGMRFPLLWVLLAFLCCVARARARAAVEQSGEPALAGPAAPGGAPGPGQGG
jgi:hypothetical protein